VSWTAHPVSHADLPGLSAATRAWLDGRWEPPTATPPLTALDPAAPRGPAWRDPDFARELRDHHQRLGAPAASVRNLERLVAGEVACVVTGQQPSLFGGSMMTVSKITGAIALADAWSARGVPCVPVFWCGADDSDFAEVRSAWLWSSATEAPFRSRLPDSAWSEGQRIGDVAADAVARVERAALGHAGDAPGRDRLRAWEADLHADLDLGQRAQAWLLRGLGERGLVVVDARSPRLRGLGADLFARYAEQHEGITPRLLERAAALRRDGWEPPLVDDALRSGLFRLENTRRDKLDPRDLASAVGSTEVTPSVALRPVWQDALLGPLAAVLGPTEFAYHAQLAPLYEALEVHAAAPVPRPHLSLLPPGIPWEVAAAAPATWLRGGEGLEARLGQDAVERRWGPQLRALGEARVRAREGFLQELGDDAGDLTSAWRDQDERWLRRWAEDLRGPALARTAAESGAWGWAPSWMAPRGIPQERILAAITGWWRCDADFATVLDQVQARYVEGLGSRGPIGFVAAGEEPA